MSSVFKMTDLKTKSQVVNSDCGLGISVQLVGRLKIWDGCFSDRIYRIYRNSRFRLPPLKKWGKLPKAVGLRIVDLLKTQINLWWLSDLQNQYGSFETNRKQIVSKPPELGKQEEHR